MIYGRDFDEISVIGMKCVKLDTTFGDFSVVPPSPTNSPLTLFSVRDHLAASKILYFIN